jgi:PhnB protein
MVKINPSLMFSGACGDAFRRYASLFGGEIVYMLTYAQSPVAESVPPDWRAKVWFARLRAGGLEITGGDQVFPDYEAPRGFSMVIGVANADEANRVFAGLAEDGEVLMPLQATHWSPRYGVVRDPFGIRWEINCDAEPAGPAA